MPNFSQKVKHNIEGIRTGLPQMCYFGMRIILS